MKKTVLRNYAKLIAQKGINVQKGQEVCITSELDQPEFVKILVEECYRAGAGKVIVDWCYQPLTKLNVRWQKEKVLSKVEEWEKARLQHKVDVLPALIYLESEDPDGLKGVNMNKLVKAQQAKRKVSKPYRDQMDNKYQWCIAAVPGAEWAKKVFPNERKSKAIEKLWEAILYTSRATGDPISNWEKHNRDLSERCKFLNSLGIETLEYKSSNGTDFKVGMIETAKFLGGSEKTLGTNVEFNANIPSEEIFITPQKGKAEGIVYSSKPLSYQGQMIENFSVRFEKGKAVEVKAEKNEELLKSIIEMDENSAYLGEVALVPYDSPIRNSGILFYNTLFDENAACHLAFGEGFTNCLEDYDSLTLEECRNRGINDSLIHVDFMIGTEDLNITAVTRKGERVEIFKNGNWAF
ncbi:MAG: aminopeptidase [Ruminococcus sp.]|nr:aminopeptidase [Ruminococcus sp.]